MTKSVARWRPRTLEDLMNAVSEMVATAQASGQPSNDVVVDIRDFSLTLQKMGDGSAGLKVIVRGRRRSSRPIDYRSARMIREVARDLALSFARQRAQDGDAEGALIFRDLASEIGRIRLSSHQHTSN